MVLLNAFSDAMMPKCQPCRLGVLIWHERRVESGCRIEDLPMMIYR